MSETKISSDDVFDITKPFTTRDGRSIEIFYSKGREKDAYFFGYIDDNICAFSWCKDGRYIPDMEDDFDLIHTPPKPVEQVFYVNVYSVFHIVIYKSRKEADKSSNPNRIGCNRIVLTDRFDD